MQSAALIDEGGYTLRERNGLAFGEIQMHSDTKLRRFTAHGHGCVECSAVCHERGAGDDAFLVGVENTSAYRLGESKIVSVDNELPHSEIALFSPSGKAIEYLAARSSPTATQKTVRILRMIAKETPSLAA